MSVLDFNLKKIALASKFKALQKEYHEFLREVSPNQWRSAGEIVGQLNDAAISVQSLTQITKEEKEINWVKKELER